MNVWIIGALIAVAVIVLAGVFAVNNVLAEEKPVNSLQCSNGSCSGQCSGSCNAGQTCGCSNCAAKTGGSCGCGK